MSTLTGEVLETLGELEVEWTVANFLSLEETVDESYRSPPFYFSGAAWNLQIYPNGQRKYNSTGWILLFLEDDISEHWNSVTYAFGLKTSEGKIEEKCRYTRDFVQNTGYTIKFLSRSELLRRKSELLPSDVLTVTCSLRFSDPNVVARSGKFSQDFGALMKNESYSDVTIRVKGEEFRLHRCVLAARIPVFDSMFSHEMREKTMGAVSIDDCEADTFRKFLDYVYTGRVDGHSSENVYGLYELADKYLVDDLKADCLKSMKNTLSVDTFFDVITLALRHNEKELTKVASEFFSDNMKEIVESEKWLDFLR